MLPLGRHRVCARQVIVMRIRVILGPDGFAMWLDGFAMLCGPRFPL